MLYLERKEQQEIYIGDNIIIKVLSIKENSVRLGIEAPKHIRILRDNALLDRPREEY